MQSFQVDLGLSSRNASNSQSRRRKFIEVRKHIYYHHKKENAITFSLIVLGQKPKISCEKFRSWGYTSMAQEVSKLATLHSVIDKKFSVVDSTGT